MTCKEDPKNKTTSTTDNHFTPSDHNAITRVTHIMEQLKENLKIAPKNNNTFNHSDHLADSNRVNITTIQPKGITIHPIVNLCQNYEESAFFQIDSAPGTNGTIQFNNMKKGRIIGFTYFLDSSMNDNVLVNVNLISPNKGRESLLNWVQGGNTFIKGTNNSTVLNFHVNMKIETGEAIQITYANTSSQDCTIMAIANLKYGEEDFE